MNSPTTIADATSQQIVVFPPDRRIGVLAAAPPFLVNYKLQKDGALGININMVYSDRDGLLCYILAYLNMAIGDGIRVFIDTGNVPVAEFQVTEAHFDEQGQAKNIPFYIMPKDLEDRFAPLLNQNKNFWYEVKRVSGNPAESSPRISLFYKHPAPGEADTDGGLPFNQGLQLPVASENFVDQSVIDDGLFVTVLQYFNQSIGDIVELAFGSLTLEKTVTALGDVIFELMPEQLATLAPTNNLLVRWQTFDVVENASGWSDALVLPFKPGIVLLNSPIFEQADLDNVLHHDELDGAPATLLITGVFTSNDQIELTLVGLTRGGDPVRHTERRVVLSATRSLSFALENERVRNLIGGSLRATYTLTRAGNTQRSKPADVTLQGTSHLLGLPTLEPLVDGKLPADAAMATVRVADYWPLKRGASVQLRWQTTDAAGVVALFIFRQLISDPTQAVVFSVPTQYIAPYANTPLIVQNSITNPGEVEVISDLLPLMISGQARIELSPPRLVNPASNPIDVPTYPQGIVVRVEYSAAKEGDQARLEALNALPGTPAFPTIKLNKNNRANFTLSPDLLTAHQGRNLRLQWVLISDGVERISPVLRLRLLAPRLILSFRDAPYSTVTGGRLNDITLQLLIGDKPQPQANVVLTLPNGFAYGDGGTGSRTFVTDNLGVATVGEVRAPGEAGSFTLNASSEAQSATAIVDIEAPGLIEWIPMSSAPFDIALAPDGKQLYAPLPYGQAVAVIDTQVLEVTKLIPVDIGPQTVSVSSDGQRLYTANRSNNVYEIDNGRQVLSRRLSVGGELAFVSAVSPDNARVYISTWEWGNVHVFNTATAARITTIKIVESPSALAFSPDGRRLYVGVNHYSGVTARLDIIDTANFGVIRRINLPSGSSPQSVVVTPDGRFAYVTLYGSGQVAVVDTASFTVSKYIAVARKPYQLVINRDGTLGYLSSAYGVISVIDLQRNEVTRTIELQGSPWFHGIALSLDGTRAYVCNSGESRIAVLRVG